MSSGPRLLTWNLFHGRDFPPGLKGGPAWRLLGRPVAGDRHLLVNRDLSREFAGLLAGARWDVALLQEVPPRWTGPLAAATGSRPVRSLTARNWMRPFTFPAARMRPHLPGSWEGGANLILLRSRQRITGMRTVTLTWRPERRVMTVLRLEGGLCVANLHATNGPGAWRDVKRAARQACRWAGEAPLVLGGDFNLRPRLTDGFGYLEERFGLTGITAQNAIDHLLVRNLPEAGIATRWPATAREVTDPGTGLRIRLSDHAPVTRYLGPDAGFGLS